MKLKKTWVLPEISFIDLVKTERPPKTLTDNSEYSFYHS